MKFCTGKEETADKLPQLKAQSRRMRYVGGRFNGSGTADDSREPAKYTRLQPCLGAWAFFSIEPDALVAAFDAACKDQGKVKHCPRNVFHIPHLFQSIYPKRR